MGKRSNFPRRPQDDYKTFDPRAGFSLRPYLEGVRTFASPCCGEGHLALQMKQLGLTCVWASDIKDGADALLLTHFNGADVIIENPPWSRHLLHPMILHFQQHAPTWLLFDSDWAFNASSAPYLDSCTDIVAVGRLKWIEDSPSSGKDNVSWYRFWHAHTGGPRFHGRRRSTPSPTPTPTSSPSPAPTPAPAPPPTPAPSPSPSSPTKGDPDMSAAVKPKPRPADLIDEYISLRKQRIKADAEFAEWRKVNFDEPMKDAENELLDFLNKSGTESIRAKTGTAFKKTSTSVTTADGAEFRRHIIGLEAWDLVDWRPNKTAINDLIENGEPLPPGINRTTFLTVSIRDTGDKT